MSDFDFDQVLNLEEDFYNQGYQEGQEFSTKEQYIEGKEYGYQTGFQRFILLGYIQGLLASWKDSLATNPELPSSLGSHLEQLESLVSSIPLTNGDEEVAMYEKKITKARNKIRVIATLTKDQHKIAKLDDLVKQVGGNLQVSENVDDMW